MLWLVSVLYYRLYSVERYIESVIFVTVVNNNLSEIKCLSKSDVCLESANHYYLRY